MRTSAIALGLLLSLGAAATPTIACEEEAQLEVQVADWSQRISNAYAMPFAEREQATEQLLAVATEASGALSALGDAALPEESIALLKVIGEAYFGAAQHHDSEWDTEADELDREWLIEAARALEPVVDDLGPMEGPAYDLRGAAGQLVEHAKRYDLPELAQWMALRVKANRYMLERMPEDDFEKQLLAESLYDYGWLSKDDTLIAEADILFTGFPEDDKPYTLRMKREAIAAGEAPY